MSQIYVEQWYSSFSWQKNINKLQNSEESQSLLYVHDVAMKLSE